MLKNYYLVDFVAPSLEEVDKLDGMGRKCTLFQANVLFVEIYVFEDGRCYSRLVVYVIRMT